ncbi:hypothetical protein [Ruminococcus sp.]|uniref:hypothetical protein n=1 Tax=Ruminococcus sp. TaxID=41978 RepID=UPI0035200D5E
MRIKVIFIIIFLLTMAFLPIIVSKCTATKTTAASVSTADYAEKPTDNSTENSEKSTIKPQQESSESKAELTDAELCGMVAANYDESYCEETLKALAVILYTNYCLAPDDYNLKDSRICILESNAENSVKENYNTIKSAVSAVYKKALCSNGKVLYIPFTSSTNGKTSSSSEYPYLTAVASPWDSYSNANDDEHCGVSLNGINYLCNDGYSYAQALQWYLPDFTIQ